MRNITVKVHPSKANLKKKDQLAWKIAEIASDKAKINKDAVEMVINRIIDNASVAIASFNRKPVTSARQMALAHPRKNGANVFGLNPKIKVDCEWAAWANGTAVRELDYHDTFLAADYSHPGDNIPGILAVAQQKGCSGMDLIKGILTGYEVQVNLVKGICLHEHKIDHIAHLGPSVAAGLGSLLKLKTEVIYQSIQQALHTTISTNHKTALLFQPYCFSRISLIWAYLFMKFTQNTHPTRLFGPTHGLRTPNEGINQRYLKNWADVADKICCRHT